MNKVLFDYTYYQAGKYHGGGEYGDTVIREILARGQGEYGIFFFANKRINREIIEECKENNWRIHPILNIREVSTLVSRFSYDTVYSALPYANSWEHVHLDENVHFIGTFHGTRVIDLASFEESELLFWNDKMGGDTCKHDYLYNSTLHIGDEKYAAFNSIFKNFKRYTVVTVSQNSKATLVSNFPFLKEENIKVLFSPPKKSYPPVDRDYLNEIGVKSNNYALVISAGIWYKNALRVVLAYDRLFSEVYSFVPSDYKLLVVGNVFPQNMISRIRNKDRFVFLSYLLPEKLERLYADAHLFVFPSLNEGFGYPPVEAMKYGTICACSVNTAIAEICGDMTILFNPLQIDEIYHKVVQSFFGDVRDDVHRRIDENYSRLEKRQLNDLEILVKLIMGD